MNAWRRMIGVARFTCQTAFRSRRALVTVLLFAAVGAGVMYLTISLFASLERDLAEMLALPATDQTGAVSMTLWKSKPFVTMVSHVVGNSLVFADIRGQHPIVLAFAGLVFSIVPVLTLLVSAPTAADEIRSGSVRYLLLRVSRNTWALGLFVGEAAVLLAATLLLALASGGVAAWWLPGVSGLTLLPAIFGWSLRAWFYALAWLGMCLGASMAVKSPGKATMLAVLLSTGFSVLNALSGIYAPALDFLCPQACKWLLWRNSFPALLEGAVGVLSVSFLWLGVGAAIFSWRDV